MMSLCYILCLVSLASKVGTVKQNTPCPNVNPVNDFKFEKQWYIISATGDAKPSGVCATMTFIKSADGGIYNVTNRWMDKKNTYYYKGTGNLLKDDTSTLNVTYPDASYNVSAIDTDNRHYALLYTCADRPADNSSDYQIWTLSHTRNLNETYMSHINATLASINLSATGLKTFNNSRESCLNGANTLGMGILVLVTALSVFTKQILL